MSRGRSRARLFAIAAASIVLVVGSLHAEEIEGKVSREDGDIVTVTIAGELLPQVGDGALVYFKIEGLDEPVEVCRGKVEAVNGREVRLKADPHKAGISAGYLVRITSERPTSALPAAGGAGTAEPKGPDRPASTDDGAKGSAKNEAAAVEFLKQLVSLEGVWRTADSDRNGMQDYWTFDVAGFHGMKDASGDLLECIDVTLARADGHGAVVQMTDEELTEARAKAGK